MAGGGGETFALAIFQTNCKRKENGNKIAIESQESLKGFEILYIHAYSTGDFFVKETSGKVHTHQQHYRK